ncbi:cell division protein FtsQ/DivIB [Symbiobacterium thermophilum]|uniref:POTRA domain-containing protein n=1 Tax=Symbiobacterium thermophilum TaxID=2734 RepID=A0A953I6J4_SYMTR|nr:FtsQ-type POTRA domain-containing protein [Symbiobacterium thermophilum]MBY6274874.1 hypothetical protein [Symbiobacterium thermophilum]
MTTSAVPMKGKGSARARSRWGFVLALAVLLGICLFAAYRSALFRLERVQIGGNERLSQAEVMAIAGVMPGDLKWEVTAERVRQRLLADPWVESAGVTWRGNALVITVTEREPLALLQYHGRFYLVLDAEGRVLGQRLLEEGERLPVVSGVTVERALRGDVLDDLGLKDALTLLWWTGEPLLEQLSEVHVRADRYLRLYLTGGTTVEVGVLPDDAAAREDHIQTQLRGLLDQLDRVPASARGRCQIDLRVYGKVLAQGCQ